MGLFAALFKRDKVTFVRRYQETKTIPQTGRSGVLTYEVYKAPTAHDARHFLNGKCVKERLFYIVVETPEGTWGKDIEGLYKE
jgi:hypothetical protein